MSDTTKRIFNVWYARQFGLMIAGGSLESTHILLRTLEKPMDLEEAWEHQQGEIWSPNGEARPLIIEKGLAHTSMSMGDVLEDANTKERWMVDFIGFKKMESAVS